MCTKVTKTLSKIINYKKQDNIKRAYHCFFINNKVIKITFMSTKTTKTFYKNNKKLKKKKRKEKNSQKDNFYKFRIKANQIFAYF